MAIKINFDVTHNPEEPTFILAKKNGTKLGQIDARSIEVTDSLNDASEVTFTVYKHIDGNRCTLWDQIVDFKLVYCVEWNEWFEIVVELNEDESGESIKTVFGTGLGESELSQINLYDIEINTEDDIARDAYTEPTVLYNKNKPDCSLLNRLMEKAPHYSIEHVDSTIANIQRMFSFDDTSIYDAFQDIAEEVNCLFVFNTNSDQNGKLKRSISVYDLESNCSGCGYRGEFTDTCPKCKSANIKEGYGQDTMIFVSTDDIAENIEFSSDTDEVKNSFKLEAGDDLMTATIRSCNPNGSDYIWYLSDNVKADMSSELVAKINSYDDKFSYYQNDYNAAISSSMIQNYNSLVTKYSVYNSELEKIPATITGYDSLMNAYYDVIDFELFLRSSMMPTVEISGTSAAKEAAKLTAVNLSPVAAESISNMSQATADNIVLSMAKIVADSTRYRIKVAASTWERSGSSCYWTGSFEVTNYSDEEDTATSSTVRVEVNDNYESFVKQKIQKALAKEDSDDMSIVGLFEKNLTDFGKELKKYSLNRLSSFYDACQTCIDVLIEQGIADKETWSANYPNLYDDLYLLYLDKLAAVSNEMKIRENDIHLVAGSLDENGNVNSKGLKNYLEDIKLKIQKDLDFESYLGNTLWLEFCAFRREDKYSNDNYISDGLNNAELFAKAREFLEVAQNEIYKSAELQHSISTNLKNLLVMEEFEPLLEDFEVGNWIRVMVDDKVYKIRLIEYSIDYENLNDISVEFSDVVKTRGSVTDVKDILSQASSMATSYTSVKRQAKQGSNSNNQLSNWVDNGLSLTNMKIISDANNQNVTLDSHGLLCREYLEETGEYSDEQLRVINRGLYVTDDGWTTSKSGIGRFSFYNPKTKVTEERYGVIADTLVGSLVLSKEVGVYNENNSISLDDNGLIITTSQNQSGSARTAFAIQRLKSDDTIEQLMYVDSDGDLVLNGDIKINGLEGYMPSLGQLADDTQYSEYIRAAAKVATDYLTHGSSGLELSYSGTTQNLYVTPNDTRIRSGETSVAKFSLREVGIGTGSTPVYINNKEYNVAATATLGSSTTQALTELSSAVQLAEITQNGSRFSIEKNGIVPYYSGKYEVSGHICVSELVAGQDVTLEIVKGSTVIQKATVTAAGSYQTIAIPPVVTTLSANQTVYLNASVTFLDVGVVGEETGTEPSESSGGGAIVGSKSAALTLKLLG